MKTLLRTGLVMCTVGALAITSGCRHRSYDNRGNLDHGNVEAAREVPAEAPTQGSVPLPEAPALKTQQPAAVGGGPASNATPAEQEPIQPRPANSMDGGVNMGGPY